MKDDVVLNQWICHNLEIISELDYSLPPRRVAYTEGLLIHFLIHTHMCVTDLLKLTPYYEATANKFYGSRQKDINF